MARVPQQVGDILDCLEERAAEQDAVSVEAVMGSFGHRTFGPGIMLPALLEITPVGAIPGVPTFLATIIAIVAAQKLFGRDHLWMPAFIRKRCVESEKIESAVEKLRPLARFMDRHFHGRWKALTHKPYNRIAAALVILLCATVPFLEVLPFASSVPMLAIAMFGLSVLVRDGVLMAIALALSFAGLGLGMDFWDGGLSDTEASDGLVDEEAIETVEKAAGDAEVAVEKAGDTVKEAAEGAIDRVEGAAAADSR